MPAEEAACMRCKYAQSVVDELQVCLNHIVMGYDREIKRLSKELERARSQASGRISGLTEAAGTISYGNIPGFSEEMRHLGDFYMKGIEGHTKDTDRAFKYYEAAAVHGCRDSSLRVGKHYLEGPEPDDGKALFFLTAAAKEGSAEAAYRVGMMHYSGMAGAGLEAEAGRWLEQAVAGGHVLARYQLATMYAQGDGMPQDRLKAHELFQAWEEQCAADAATAASTHSASLDSHSERSCPASPTAPHKGIREGAQLESQVESVRDRIAKLSVQLQSPVMASLPR